jgi:hypothetical protein
MALVALGGAGVWIPTLANVWTQPSQNTTDAMLMDADQEEAQYFGSVTIDGGGSKTFGTSGSKIGWLPGATVTFATGSTLRVGVKQASKITTTAGPPPRATIGAAAFDVSRVLTGGTDTITSTTWREDTMNAGTPFTVADGDLLAICFLLSVTSGTPSVKLRQQTGTNSQLFGTQTIVTSGPTYTLVVGLANLMITFDDGTLGWLEPTKVFTGAAADNVSANVGNGNAFGNIIQVPMACRIDALAATVTTSSATADFALELLSTPLGTPTIIDTLAHDANILSITGASRAVMRRLPTPRTLAANTAYAISVKQTTATALTLTYTEVSTATYFRPTTLAGAQCYAANSTAGATFVAANSTLRRYQIWMRLSALDDGAGGALRTSRIPKREALRFARSRV